jgi:glutamine synthetase
MAFASNTANLKKYLDLDQGNKKYIAEYVWIDASGGVRSKCRTLKKTKIHKRPQDATKEEKENLLKATELPEWNFDGSSTGQAPGDNSDVYLKPVAWYPDPFRGGDNILVMTETWMSDGTPNAYNFRHAAAKLMERYKDHEFQFGLEQEYTLLDMDAGPMAGPRVATQLHRALITAESALERSWVVTSSTHITRHACTPKSKSQAPTQRSCPDSGNTRSELSMELTWVTSFGCLASSSSV